MEHQIQIHRGKPLSEVPAEGHNRWHPDIAPLLRIRSGDTVTLETRDALDGFIRRNSAAEDLLRLDFGVVHPLTGPIYVEGAQPGDLLEVKVLEVRPEATGFTSIAPGFGFLREYFPNPFLAIWEISGGFAVSRQLPRVRIPGAPFMGVMGVAPSRELMDRVALRESELLQRGGMVLLPSPGGAVPDRDGIAREGLRTIPPRENGGNVDIKQLTAGTTVLFPVFVPGALFSAGDAHFAQGDGESCGTAVEMGATLSVQLTVRKSQHVAREQRSIQFEYVQDSAHAKQAEKYHVTTGLPLTADGRNESEDIRLAAKNALLKMIDFLVEEYEFTKEQAYAITSVAVDLKISQAVDVPNVLVSAFLPLRVMAG